MIFREPDQLLFEALSTKVPFSFFARLAVVPATPLRSKAALSVKVLPFTTSIVRTKVVLLSWIVGEPVMVSVMRKAEIPVVGLSATVAPPKAARLPIETTPWETVIVEIELEALLKTSVPAPDFVKPEEAVMTPASSRPWVRLESVTVPTL